MSAGVIALSMIGVLAAPPAVLAAEAWPGQVDAIYKIHFSGLELGDFHFSSRVQQNAYTTTSNAQITALFGAYEWKGQSLSAGMTTAAGPKPASYAFNFKNQSKVGSVQMSFAGNAVTKVAAVPPIEVKPGTVELKETHLKDVLDPLSAVMALTRSTTGRIAGINPCTRRIPVFDGKQRFDLVFSYKRSAPLSEVGSKSPLQAFVCRVKYVPISGHKMNKETKFMASTNDIEIWLIPVDEAKLFVPYYVSLPTPMGAATITSAKVNIDTPGGGRVALTN